MALNELINQIVDVQIRNVTSNTYSRDLNTIAILAKHDVFTSPEIYRTYQDSSSMVEDGFDLNSYAYNAVRTIFSQEITPVNVVVGRVATSGANEDYLTAFNQLLMIPQGWLWLISDLRDVPTQVQLAGLVQANDKMYLAATHAAAALDPLLDTDLSSQVKALSYSNTVVWFDDELPPSNGGDNGEVTPPPISCDGATNTSGCISLEGAESWSSWEEGAIDLEVNGVKVLSNASQTDLETYLFNNGDIENDLTMECGCPNGYVRSVRIPYHRYEQGQTLYLPISLKPNGQSITTPFTVQGTTQGQMRNFIADTLNSQLEPYGLYCVYGLFASDNIYLGVPDNRAKFNYKETEFYILDEGNTFTSEEISRGLPPYYCWYPT